MTIEVNLISQYKNYRMLTNTRKLEFNNGVCVVKFDSEDEAKSFVKSIEDNPALTPYCRVASYSKAKEVAQAHMASQSETGIKAGVQTSEIPPQIALATNPTSAQAILGDSAPASETVEVAKVSEEESVYNGEVTETTEVTEDNSASKPANGQLKFAFQSGGN